MSLLSGDRFWLFAEGVIMAWLQEADISMYRRGNDQAWRFSQTYAIIVGQLQSADQSPSSSVYSTKKILQQLLSSS